MSDRVLILLLVIGAIVVSGQIARRISQRRRAAAIASMHLDPSDDGQPRIVSFYGPACSACDRQKLILSELESERAGRLSIELHDATQEYDYARQFGLMVVPTTVVIDANGAIRGINSGFTARPVLEEQLDAA